MARTIVLSAAALVGLAVYLSFTPYQQCGEISLFSQSAAAVCLARMGRQDDRPLHLGTDPRGE